MKEFFRISFFLHLALNSIKKVFSFRVNFYSNRFISRQSFTCVRDRERERDVHMNTSCLGSIMWLWKWDLSVLTEYERRNDSNFALRTLLKSLLQIYIFFVILLNFSQHSLKDTWRHNNFVFHFIWKFTFKRLFYFILTM